MVWLLRVPWRYAAANSQDKPTLKAVRDSGCNNVAIKFETVAINLNCVVGF
jgi:hypothetical protein